MYNQKLKSIDERLKKEEKKKVAGGKLRKGGGKWRGRVEEAGHHTSTVNFYCASTNCIDEQLNKEEEEKQKSKCGKWRMGGGKWRGRGGGGGSRREERRAWRRVSSAKLTCTYTFTTKRAVSMVGCQANGSWVLNEDLIVGPDGKEVSMEESPYVHLDRSSPRGTGTCRRYSADCCCEKSFVYLCYRSLHSIYLRQGGGAYNAQPLWYW